MKRTFTLLGGRLCDDGRSPKTLPPRPRRAGSQPRSAPHRIRGVRLARRGAHALLRAERRLPLARRRMEIPLCGRRPRPARRRDGRRRRHFGVERHPRSGQLGVAGTRHADLRQHALRIRHDRSRAAAPARGDSGRRLPPHLHRSRSVGGTQDLPDDRRRQIGRLRLCQRAAKRVTTKIRRIRRNTASTPSCVRARIRWRSK